MHILCGMAKCVWNSKKHLDSWNLCHNQAKHVIKNAVTKNLCFLCRHTYSYANLTSVFINAFGEFLWNFPISSERSINPDCNIRTHTHGMCTERVFLCNYHFKNCLHAPYLFSTSQDLLLGNRHWKFWSRFFSLHSHVKLTLQLYCCGHKKSFFVSLSLSLVPIENEEKILQGYNLSCEKE